MENKEKENKEERKTKEISIDVISNIGKKIKLAGHEYTIVPINISDMNIVINNLLLLPISTKKEEELADYYYGLNVVDEKRAEIFFYITEKYLKYGKENAPVTKELIEEHNWTFRDIKDFLKEWIQVSD